MANKEQLAILNKGVDVWNEWRQKNPLIEPDLSKARLNNRLLQNVNFSKTNLTNSHFYKTDLTHANLKEAIISGADLSEADLGLADLTFANLQQAKLTGAYFIMTNLTGANLNGVHASEVDFFQANFNGARLIKAHLKRADFEEATLYKADFTGADMSYTKIIGTKMEGAILNNCNIFGISVWGPIDLEKAEQSNLVITQEDPIITVDNIELAQFIYILLNSERIRKVIDTITSKVVLILGRFNSKRKPVLDALRRELRKRNYSPILFDVDKPTSRDITETVVTLANMSKFVIADITNARSIPQELTAIVPNLPSVPIQPILLSSAKEYGMFEHFKRYPWVLETYRYNNLRGLLKNLDQKVITPAENKRKEQQGSKTEI